MKKILLIVMMLVVVSLAYAESQQGIHEPGTGIEDPDMKAAGSGQGMDDVDAVPVRAEAGDMIQAREMDGNGSQVRGVNAAQAMQSMRQEMDQERQRVNLEASGAGEKKGGMMQNENRVRLAVHALLGLENYTGGVGKNISAIAREFNNSAMKQVKAEEKIATRSGFKRFFAGGDAKAAEEIEAEVNANRERLQKLQMIQDTCDCDMEVKAMMQEQIRDMQQEQVRLEGVASEAKSKKGIFGWMWK